MCQIIQPINSLMLCPRNLAGSDEETMWGKCLSLTQPCHGELAPFHLTTPTPLQPATLHSRVRSHTYVSETSSESTINLRGAYHHTYATISQQCFKIGNREPDSANQEQACLHHYRRGSSRRQRGYRTSRCQAFQLSRTMRTQDTSTFGWMDQTEAATKVSQPG